jgi:hypothetical protein
MILLLLLKKINVSIQDKRLEYKQNLHDVILSEAKDLG